MKCFVRSLFVATLLASTMLTGVASADTLTQVGLDPNLKIHPLLQVGAATEPAQVVRVIVQMTKPDLKAAQISSLVPGLTVVEQFSVVPAAVVDVPQGALRLLAGLPEVRYVSPDSPVLVAPTRPGQSHAAKLARPKPSQSRHGISSADLLTTYPFDTHANDAWSGIDGHSEVGSNQTVALIDSGVDAEQADLAGHVLAVNVNSGTQSTSDGYGHGTHVAGIIGGQSADGKYLGIAPDATLISVKVADDNGNASESDLLRGIDWVFVNGPAYHIRVVNLSVSVAVPESYATSPVDAAVERLWAANITVVAAAGNLGDAPDAVWYAPGNDPLVISVGCLDDNGSVAPGDDSLCPISSRGITEDGFAKPEIVAPGRKIVSALASGSILATEFADRITADGEHIRLSGTSMADPIVAGAAALLLERHPGLTPGQLKQILVGSETAYPDQPDRAGELNIASALVAAEHPPANRAYVPVPVTDVAPKAGISPLVWDGARWSSTYFDGARWSSAYWDGARWSGSMSFDGARWSSAYWDGARWSSATFDGARWSGSTSFDGARWSSSTSFDGSRWSNATWD